MTDAAGDSLAIETHGLTKNFGRQVAVDDLSLAVPRGAVFGFLGPNGSGKTTTIRMLLGLASASTGQIRMLGSAIPDRSRSVLPRVGALVEGPAFYPFLSGAANLRRFDSADRHATSATRTARVNAALDRVGLSHAANKPAHAYSLGMKQRLGIANALLQPRQLLILDEPSNGLDPQGTREVRNLIRSLADDGTTIFLSSHLLAEVEQICSHIAVMSVGRLVAQGTLDDLRAAGIATVQVRTPDPALAVTVLRRLNLMADVTEPTHPTGPDSDPLVSAPLSPGSPAIGSPTAESPAASSPAASSIAAETIAAALVEAGVRVRGFAVVGASLEERFVALTGEGFDVAQ
ncbi:ABC-2 type transport system ATP-binding protein [Glaciihabitans tibetensis]|uniref:ABC-2 type transport system ATP-binding protein n=1 Tax=Glaciihabitans tibetensis TaxID=1266600 RepID=A0A2T0VGQ4_9MICO|nr:ATP-binding cassette domain-containing protein [Glaciihabitans tibetensis]PRY69380.1 ABC-2 type transport system ATP-binding protein [Glaciihabitans tibetensis]